MFTMPPWPVLSHFFILDNFSVIRKIDLQNPKNYWPNFSSSEVHVFHKE